MYRTTATIVILSENPIPDGLPIDVIIRECDYGDYVMGDQSWTQEELSVAQMKAALLDADSDPEFFDID